jgi:hypothetical protein
MFQDANIAETFKFKKASGITPAELNIKEQEINHI